MDMDAVLGRDRARCKPVLRSIVVAPTRTPSEQLPAAELAKAAATLCTACGLCCDGTLYGQVALEGASNGPLALRLAKRGFAILQDGGGATAFKQPCPALRGALCDMYEERPPACARYACLLRTNVESGRTELPVAERIVVRARTLSARIRAGFPLERDRSLWEGITALEPPPDEAEEQAWAEAHADAIDAVASLIELVRAEFEPRFAGGKGKAP